MANLSRATAPSTSQRPTQDADAGNRRQCPPHQHCDWKAIFIYVVDYLRKVQRRAGVMEQVTGFAAMLKEGVDDCGAPPPQSWLLRFLDVLTELGYSSQVLSMNNNEWTEAPRERFRRIQKVMHTVTDVAVETQCTKDN